MGKLYFYRISAILPLTFRKMKNLIIIFLLTAGVWQLSFFGNFKVSAQTVTPTPSPSSTITPTISITAAPNPTTTTTPSADNTPTSTPISLTPTIIKKATIIIKKPTATMTPEPTVTPEPTITPTPTTVGFMEKISGRTLTFFFILSGLILMGTSFVLYRKRG